MLHQEMLYHIYCEKIPISQEGEGKALIQQRVAWSKMLQYVGCCSLEDGEGGDLRWCRVQEVQISPAAPCSEVGTPGSEVETPDREVETPGLDVESAGLEVETPGPKVAAGPPDVKGTLCWLHQDNQSAFN